MTPQDLRLMRKKARVSLKALAQELAMSRGRLRAIEDGRLPWAFRDWADRYVEALTRLTA
jgi:transcriptional regulator with XRE-family HTH domain